MHIIMKPESFAHRYHAKAILILTAILLSAASTALAQESWLQFRGPNGQGAADSLDIPDSWSVKDCRWRVELPGIGASSPVVDGDQVFVTSALDGDNQDDGTRVVQCLRTDDGSQIWRREFPGPNTQIHSTNTHAPSTPVLDDEKVYMIWGTAEDFVAMALKRSDGELVWQRDLGKHIAKHGFGVSPILYDGKLIVPYDTDEECYVLALDAMSGNTIWKTPEMPAADVEDASYATPIIFDPQNINKPGKPQIVIASWSAGTIGLDPDTGEQLWKVEMQEYRPISTPLLSGDRLFISGGSGGMGREMFCVRAGIPEIGQKAEILYEIDGRLPYDPSPVAKDGLLFFMHDKGVVRCVEIETGKDLWEHRYGGMFYSSLALIGDRIYATERGGDMYVFRAARQFEPLAEIYLEEDSDASPAVADEVLYIRTKSHLMAIGGE